MGLKIGILLPKSDMFPALGLNLLNGINLSLKINASKLDPQFIVEGVGNAADDSILKIIDKLILQESIDLLIGFFSISRLKELTPKINSYKIPFIHIDLGGSILKKECKSPNMLHLSLGLCQSAYAAGMYAAKNFGNKGFAASSFYDGGYQLTESFNRGFKKNGGTIENYYVSILDYKSDTYEKMLKDIEETQPDIMFVVFSYNEGKKVFDILSNSNFNGKIPIVAIPVMTDEIINKEDYSIEKVYSMASWSFDDTTIQMQNFIKEYYLAYEESPNIMGLLGYESGQVLLESCTAEGKINHKLSEVLKNKVINSPRGKISFNAMNESQTESFKLRTFNFNKKRYHNTVINEFDTSFTEELYSEFESIPFTGWMNPYICT